MKADMADPVDPDVDLHVPAQRAELKERPWPVLGAISAGGALGSLARYGLSTAWPHDPGGFPWATFVINVSGSFLLGTLMVLIGVVWAQNRLVRPFLGVGVLGGFTTFSTYVLDIQSTVAAGRPGVALAYLAATLFVGLAATWTGMALTGRLVRR
jgi:CrcB protein